MHGAVVAAKPSVLVQVGVAEKTKILGKGKEIISDAHARAAAVSASIYTTL